jgi:hypothetical protein
LRLLACNPVGCSGLFRRMIAESKAIISLNGIKGLGKGLISKDFPDGDSEDYSGFTHHPLRQLCQGDNSPLEGGSKNAPALKQQSGCANRAHFSGRGDGGEITPPRNLFRCARKFRPSLKVGAGKHLRYYGANATRKGTAEIPAFGHGRTCPDRLTGETRRDLGTGPRHRKEIGESPGGWRTWMRLSGSSPPITPTTSPRASPRSGTSAIMNSLRWSGRRSGTRQGPSPRRDSRCHHCRQGLPRGALSGHHQDGCAETWRVCAGGRGRQDRADAKCKMGNNLGQVSNTEQI